MVNVVTFQAIDPGSIPGQRSVFYVKWRADRITKKKWSELVRGPLEQWRVHYFGNKFGDGELYRV